MSNERLRLLFVAGLTPQIITETLCAITQQRKEIVDEIRVITTLGGRDRLLKSLLDPTTGKFFEFCRDYEIDPATIKFDETTITLL
ncbi:MAG: CRISPR-associated ring nuclease, partial [Acidobacteria bacterium]|nr:CRISPR-associated ring nuclease [Acidobacteriota bacterium]